MLIQWYKCNFQENINDDFSNTELILKYPFHNLSDIIFN